MASTKALKDTYQSLHQRLLSLEGDCGLNPKDQDEESLALCSTFLPTAESLVNSLKKLDDKLLMRQTLEMGATYNWDSAIETTIRRARCVKVVFDKLLKEKLKVHVVAKMSFKESVLHCLNVGAVGKYVNFLKHMNDLEQVLRALESMLALFNRPIEARSLSESARQATRIRYALFKHGIIGSATKELADLPANTAQFEMYNVFAVLIFLVFTSWDHNEKDKQGEDPAGVKKVMNVMQLPPTDYCKRDSVCFPSPMWSGFNQKEIPQKEVCQLGIKDLNIGWLQDKADLQSAMYWMVRDHGDANLWRLQMHDMVIFDTMQDLLSSALAELRALQADMQSKETAAVSKAMTLLFTLLQVVVQFLWRAFAGSPK